MGEWRPEFGKHSTICKETENESYIEFPSRALSDEFVQPQFEDDGNEEDQAEHGDEEESAIRRFMRGDELNVCLPQADKVEKFCVGASLDSLQEGAAAEALPPIAYLYERACQEGTPQSRPDIGRLNARDLYRQLRRPVRNPGIPPELPSYLKSVSVIAALSAQQIGETRFSNE